MPLDLIKLNLIRFKTRKYVVHSDLTIFGRKINYFKSNVVETFIRELDASSLAIPTFNLNTNATSIIDFSDSDSRMGALPREAIVASQKGLGFRLRNPIHSYTFFPENSEIKKINCGKSFGAESVFDYFFHENYCWISLGVDVNSGFTIFHHLEDLANVPYRKKIFFDRIVLENDKKRLIRFEYFARVDETYRQNFDRAVHMLAREDILTVSKVNNRFIYTGLVRNISNFILAKLREDPFFLVSKSDRY